MRPRPGSEPHLTRRRLLAAGLTLLGGCTDATASGPRTPPTPPAKTATTQTATPSPEQAVVEAVNRVYRAVREALVRVDPTAYDAGARTTAHGALADAEDALAGVDDAALDSLVTLHRLFVSVLDRLRTVFGTVRAHSPADVRTASAAKAALDPARTALDALGEALARLDREADAVDSYPTAAFLDADAVDSIRDAYREVPGGLTTVLDATATRLRARVRWVEAETERGDAASAALQRARESYASARDALDAAAGTLPTAFAELATYGACLAAAGVDACDRALDAVAAGEWPNDSSGPNVASACEFGP